MTDVDMRDGDYYRRSKILWRQVGLGVNCEDERDKRTLQELVAERGDICTPEEPCGLMTQPGPSVPR